MSLRSTLHVLLDRLAAAWSLLCAVHCAVLPLVLALAPALALGVLWSEQTERWTVIVVSLVGLVSLGGGWWRHRSVWPLTLLSAGLVLMWSALLVTHIHESVPAHALAMAAGGVIVAAGHLLNLRLVRGHVHGPACAGARGSC